jgi:aryl-alcohol dehydrogenase-like predicted oxidoreductase
VRGLVDLLSIVALTLLHHVGTMDKESSFKLLDAFVEAGGNFIDTANNYQDEESEQFIGEWMAERKNRDRIVLATKFTVSLLRRLFGETWLRGINLPS